MMHLLLLDLRVLYPIGFILRNCNSYSEGLRSIDQQAKHLNLSYTPLNQL